MQELADELGPCAYKNQMPKIIEIVQRFLDKKMGCQTGINPEAEVDDEGEEVEEEYDDEEEDEDDLDHDEIILGNVVDFIDSLAKAFGNEFKPAFDQIVTHLAPYTNDNHPKFDRNAALGCYSENFAACPAIIPDHYNFFLQFMESMSKYNDEKINRNIAYSIGVLAENAGDLFKQHIQPMLTLLGTLHANTKAEDAQDNILAGMLRIAEFHMMPLPKDQRPAQYAEILNQLYAKIPLEGDYLENITALKFTYKLYQDDQALCVSYMDNIAKTCVKVVADPRTAEQTKTTDKREVGQFLKTVVVQHA